MSALALHPDWVFAVNDTFMLPNGEHRVVTDVGNGTLLTQRLAGISNAPDWPAALPQEWARNHVIDLAHNEEVTMGTKFNDYMDDVNSRATPRQCELAEAFDAHYQAVYEEHFGEK